MQWRQKPTTANPKPYKRTSPAPPDPLPPQPKPTPEPEPESPLSPPQKVRKPRAPKRKAKPRSTPRSERTRSPARRSSKSKSRTPTGATGEEPKGKPKKLSRQTRPEGMTLEEWQRALRREFGREQNFQIENVGQEPVFSEFDVTNPQSGRTYRLHVRGTEPGDNHCSCADFQTNLLGTCKHIEFTLAHLEALPGGLERLQAGFQPEYSEVTLHYGARREVRFRVGAGCPQELARLVVDYFDNEGVLQASGFGRFERFLEDVAKLDHEVRTHPEVMAFVAEVRDAEHRAQRVAEAFPKGIKSPAFRDLLKVSLYDYQREGALFAARVGRCLIGDEMGLGKTIQALATAEIMAQLFGIARVLVICPTSLKYQWEREIQRFSTRTVDVIQGWRQGRARHYTTDSFFKITNYDTIYYDLDLIANWRPDLVILDEAQRIKNWETRTAKSVKRIESPYALVLTGTPLENRLEELMSIVQFVDRFRLGPTYRLQHEHQVRDEWGKVIGYRDLDRVGRTLAPIMLRRHKDQVANQLPERIDTNIFVPVTDVQRKQHTENMTYVAEVVEKWKRLGFLSDTDKQRLMIALLRMRMACDNSYLVDHRTVHGPKTAEISTLLEEILEDPGVKVVLFSQWLRMHELLAREFKEHDWRFVLFHGSVPGIKRRELVDRFRDDPKCRLFLSTDAGGTGLNLQHASVVINVDLPWNPAVLEQRIGRVHRLGQLRPVRVVNFVSQGTIEESMLEVLKFKKSLFSGILDGGDKDVFMGGSRLTKFMEHVEKITTNIPPNLLDDAEDVLRRPNDDVQGDDESVAGGHQGRGPGGKAAASGGKGPKGSQPQPVGSGTGQGNSGPSNGDILGQGPGAPGTAIGDPWSGLLQMGMSLLQQFVGGLANGGGQNSGSTGSPEKPAAPVGPRIVRDEQTGENYVRMPMPSPEVVEQALTAVQALLQNFRR